MHRTRRIVGVVLALLTLLAGFSPKVGVAGGLAWENAEWVSFSSWTWIQAGSGLNLTTGEPGEDLLFDGQTVAAERGILLLNDLDTTLNPPSSGFVTSIETAQVERRVILVRLAGGGFAQVKFGMGWRSGSGYSNLQVDTVLLSQVLVEPEPASAPADQGGSASSPSTTRVVWLQLDNPIAKVNGQPQTLDVPPQLLEGSTMVPLRFVAEALGAELKWDAPERRTLSTETRTVVLWVDQKRALINGQTVRLDVAPSMLSGRTMVPLRFAADSLGAELIWNPSDRSITLIAGGAAIAGSDQATTGTPVPAMTCDFRGETGLVQTVSLGSVTPNYMVIANDCTAWVYDNHAVKLFKVRLADGQVMAEVKTSNNFVAAITYNPANDQIYRIDRDGYVEFFDGTSGAAVGTLDLPRANWCDIPQILGAVADPQAGQLFLFSSEQIWAVDKEGKVTGPVQVDAGPGGISDSGSVVRGRTLWLLGQPWNGSPGLAVPVNADTMAVGTPISVIDGDSVNFALGSAMRFIRPTARYTSVVRGALPVPSSQRLRMGSWSRRSSSPTSHPPRFYGSRLTVSTWFSSTPEPPVRWLLTGSTPIRASKRPTNSFRSLVPSW